MMTSIRQLAPQVETPKFSGQPLSKTSIPTTDQVSLKFSGAQGQSAERGTGGFRALALALGLGVLAPLLGACGGNDVETTVSVVNEDGRTLNENHLSAEDGIDRHRVAGLSSQILDYSNEYGKLKDLLADNDLDLAIELTYDTTNSSASIGTEQLVLRIPINGLPDELNVDENFIDAMAPALNEAIDQLNAKLEADAVEPTEEEIAQAEAREEAQERRAQEQELTENFNIHIHESRINEDLSEVLNARGIEIEVQVISGDDKVGSWTYSEDDGLITVFLTEALADDDSARKDYHRFEAAHQLRIEFTGQG